MRLHCVTLCHTVSHCVILCHTVSHCVTGAACFGAPVDAGCSGLGGDASATASTSIGSSIGCFGGGERAARGGGDEERGHGVMQVRNRGIEDGNHGFIAC